MNAVAWGSLTRTAWTRLASIIGLPTVITLLFATPAQSLVPFTEEAVTRGLVYVVQDYPQVDGHFGFGCGFADLDGDHDPDAVILGAADGHVGIFENDGTGNFTDRSTGSGIPLLTQAVGFVAFDYDGDGDQDLYFAQMAAVN